MKGSIDRVWIAGAALLACLALGAPPAHAGWTVVGTAVQKDGYTAAPGITVVVMPDSVSSTTDASGDFFVPWSGARGWLDLRAGGTDFCKRIALSAKQSTAGDSILDLGSVTAESTGRFFGRGRAFAPRGTAPPDTLFIAGPEPGQPDRYKTAYLVVCDIWGQPTTARFQSGDTPPPQLDAAIVAWIRSVPWSVNAESPCGIDEPFRTAVSSTYWWRDGVWVYLPNAGSGRLDAPEGR